MAWCRNHVLLEDVEYFLEKSKAKECFDMLDLDKDGKVSLQVRIHFLTASCTWLTYTPPYCTHMCMQTLILVPFPSRLLMFTCFAVKQSIWTLVMMAVQLAGAHVMLALTWMQVLFMSSSSLPCLFSCLLPV